MKQYHLICSFFILILPSCQNASPEYVITWTKQIKEKIIEDANEIPDEIKIDTLSNSITLYRKGKKLKSFIFQPTFEATGKKILKDTAVSKFFSTDQRFVLVKELCPGANQNFEGLIYDHHFIGYRESKFCSGKIKQHEFYYNSEPIGPSIEYDSLGNIIKQIENGKDYLFKEFKKIKYNR
jgi:hypothetical protein